MTHVLHGSGAEYKRVHDYLRETRGYPGEYDCHTGCGEPANEWSYSGPGHNESSGAYSWNLSWYVPRCWSCHAKFDGRNFSPEARVKGRSAFVSLPNYREILQTGGRTQGPRNVENGTMAKARVIRDEMISADPEFRKKYQSFGAKLSARRFACHECDMVTSPGALGRHQSYSGHTGKTEVSQ